MPLSDNAMTLADAVEEYGPSEDGELSVVLIQFDEMADPLTSDLFTMISGWEDAGDVGLQPPKEGYTFHYVDEDGEIYSTADMVTSPPDWFDEPAQDPDWYELVD